MIDLWLSVMASFKSAAARDYQEERTTKFAQEEDQRHFGRLIGKLPVPGAISIGAAKGALHLNAQAQRVDLEALRQIRLQRLGYAQDCESACKSDPLGWVMII